MDFTLFLKPIIEMISSGNYAGAVMSIGVVAFVFMWKKLSKIEKSQEPKPEVKTDYNKFIIEDSLIMEELEAIRMKYNADRISIIDLQNGSYNLNKINSLKIFVRGERLKQGVFSVANLINGIPASFYSRVLSILVKDEVYKLEEIEQIKSFDYGLFEQLLQSNVKSLYAFPLISNEGVLYGYISIHFCIDKRTLSKDEVKSIKADSERINGELLMLKSQ